MKEKASLAPESETQLAALAPLPVMVIQPSKGLVSLKLNELWEYRELLFFLTWRDIKIRYKQTALGAAWAILQPFLTMVVFSIFFGRLAKVPSDGIPYPIFSYCGLLPWQLFANALTQSSNSLVASQGLITKVYFPRLIIPISAVLGGAGGFRHCFRGPVGHDGLLRHRPHLGRPDFAPVSLAGHCHGPGGRLMALGPQRPVPRCALYHNFFGAVLALRYPHRLPQQSGAGTMAPAVRLKPHGRGGGGVSLGPVGESRGVGADGHRFGGSGLPLSRRRPGVLSAHGKDLCRRGLDYE